MPLPKHGLPADQILAQLDAFAENDLDWRSGRVFAYHYDPGPEAEALGKQAYLRYLKENALDPTAFPSMMAMENQVVALAAEHLGGDRGVAGNFTSGGTESIILAVKTARDHARAHRPNVTRPNLVLPTTAHAAFHKACHYLDVEPRLFDVSAETFRAGPEDAARVMDDQTIQVVGSAPSYAHGVVDDIEGLAGLARERGVLMHVDACMGGWLLPYFRRLGAEVPAFDFSVDGVTSISMDLHKYAFCMKGASVVLHRSAALREHQIYACSGWTGYTVVNPTIQSTKTGGPLAAAWAMLHFIGDQGYVEHARVTLEATQRLLAGLDAIDGLEVMGRPDFCLVAAASDSLNVFHVADEMKQRGWYIQPQLGFRVHKENIHFSVSPGVAPQIPAMLDDLADAVAAARALPATDIDTLQAALQHVDPDRLSDEGFLRLLALAGVEGLAVPERMAGINELLNRLPPSMADALLTRFYNHLNHQG